MLKYYCGNHLTGGIKMKKTTIFLTLMTALLLLACTSVLADASGDMYALYESSVIVDNSWEYIESEKTLYIYSKTSNYNETGQLSYSPDGAWGAYKDEIEHVVLVGAFSKCSTNAFKDHTALRDIRITDQTNQFDGSCFDGCTNLESVTVGMSEHISGYANLKNATIIRQNAFIGTKIKEAAIGSACQLKGENHFERDTKLYTPRGYPADTFFRERGYTVLDNTPVRVSILFGETTHTISLDPYMATEIAVIGGDIVALYSDESCTMPYGGETLKEGAVLYARTVLTLKDILPRVESYSGIRAIFSADPDAASVESSYEITEIGALAVKQGESIRTPLFIDTAGIHKAVIFNDSGYTGKLLISDGTGPVDFALSAVGFEDNSAISAEKAETQLFFRGYTVFREKNSGKEITYYTDIEKTSLATLADVTLKNFGTSLSEAERKFISAPLAAGASPTYIYTKEELLSVLREVYELPDQFIIAQHLQSGANSLDSFINASIAETGTYPALVAFDFESMTLFDENSKIFVADCKEYISRGGIIAFSYHMENPTGNYTDQGLCRGELGDESAWHELVTPGTALNKKFNEIIDRPLPYLKAFDDEGYPVIWRPFHENNGNWFWWCAIQTFEENGKTVERAVSKEVIVELWKYVYDRFTVTHGLRHLVWAYSPNVTQSDSPKDVLYCYPGDEYCDIAGTDWYTSGNMEISGSNSSYKRIMSVGKISALTEFGPSGALKADSALGQIQSDIFSCRDQLELIKRMQAEGMKFCYVLNWNGPYSVLSLGEPKVIMNSSYTLDIFEVAELFGSRFSTRK